MEFGPGALGGSGHYGPRWRLVIGADGSDQSPITLEVRALFDYGAGGTDGAAADTIEGALVAALTAMAGADNVTSVSLLRVAETTTALP